jgi:hypothetical protein
MFQGFIAAIVFLLQRWPHSESCGAAVGEIRAVVWVDLFSFDVFGCIALPKEKKNF